MNQSTDLANTLRHVRPDDLNLLLEHWDFMNALFVKPGALGIAEIISGIKTPGKAMLLLYRSHPGNGGLVFAPLINALHVGFTHIAIQSAHTWEDFKRMVPDSELSRLEESFADSDDPLSRITLKAPPMFALKAPLETRFLSFRRGDYFSFFEPFASLSFDGFLSGRGFR
jgi:hypothetical protein